LRQWALTGGISPRAGTSGHTWERGAGVLLRLVRGAALG